MKVTMFSMFRNGFDHLTTWWSQVQRLRALLPGLELVVAEGDSTDLTYDWLKLHIHAPDRLLKIDHGGPNLGSIDDPVRWANIAKVVTAMVAEVPDPGDVVLWVEGDLRWEPEGMERLIHDALAGWSVAPKCLGPGRHVDRWYDTWGYRSAGKGFEPQAPYWPAGAETKGRFVKLDSCGSCFATSDFGALAAWDGLWPYRAGGELWLDTDVEVLHP